VRGVKSWLLLGGSSQCTSVGSVSPSAGSKEEIKLVFGGARAGGVTFLGEGMQCLCDTMIWGSERTSDLARGFYCRLGSGIANHISTFISKSASYVGTWCLKLKACLILVRISRSPSSVYTVFCPHSFFSKQPTSTMKSSVESSNVMTGEEQRERMYD